MAFTILFYPHSMLDAHDWIGRLSRLMGMSLALSLENFADLKYHSIHRRRIQVQERLLVREEFTYAIKEIER
jgi:hypothetical protein